jgi:hypothetical protein
MLLPVILIISYQWEEENTAVPEAQWLAKKRYRAVC